VIVIIMQFLPIVSTILSAMRGTMRPCTELSAALLNPMVLISSSLNCKFPSPNHLQTIKIFVGDLKYDIYYVGIPTAPNITGMELLIRHTKIECS
jgi:hypothetical protein